MSVRVSDRVTRVIYTRYAVGSKPGVCRDNRPDAPPAGRDGTFFFRNMWDNVPHVPEKDKTYHAAAGEIRHHREQTAHLNAYRVSPVIYHTTV